MNRLVARLLRDDSGVTPLEYVAAAVALVLAACAVSRSVAGVLTSFLYRIHIVAALLVR
jgi:Flp pilus assembly pilin Flp